MTNLPSALRSLSTELEGTDYAFDEVCRDAADELERLKQAVSDLERKQRALDRANRLGVYAVPLVRDGSIWWRARTRKGFDLPHKLLQQASCLGAFPTLESALHWAAEDAEAEKKGTP